MSNGFFTKLSVYEHRLLRRWRLQVTAATKSSFTKQKRSLKKKLVFTNLLFYKEVGVTKSSITKLAFVSIYVSSNRKLASTNIFYYKLCIYGVFDFKVNAYNYLLLQR